MADPIFEDPRLAALYDLLEGARPDLDPYVAMVAEFGAARVLDLGCGTGTLACLLAQRGVEVTAVDPARACLDVARRKAFADRVHWVLGDASTVAPLDVDMVTMTGNVAQVFLTDGHWTSTLRSVCAVLASRGRLVFETRDPDRQAWRDWTPAVTQRHLELPAGGRVELWTEVLEVHLPLVRFRQSIRFGAEPVPLVSHSTLRFRSRHEVVASLTGAGFEVQEVRDAPDRPGLEFVVVARRPG